MQWAPLLPRRGGHGTGDKDNGKAIRRGAAMRTEMPAELAVSSSTTLDRQRSPRERGSDGKLFSRDAIIAPRLDSKRKYTQIIVYGRFALPASASFFKGEKTIEAEDRDRLFSEL